VLGARAEELAHDSAYREKYDIATARAVGHLGIICELASGYVKCGGKLLFYKGAKAADEMQAAKKMLGQLGLSRAIAENYSIEDIHSGTCMVVLEKIKKLSGKYPRSFAKIKKAY
jgi:16S rRNA (guanine527-N7)-methyltransferase